jgi:uncharacterized iron-regulated membrane protein
MKRLFRKLHLWLGLISGLVVIIVCLTGALSLFRPEIESMMEPWRHVQSSKAPSLSPQQLIGRANLATGLSHPTALTMGMRTEAAKMDYMNENGNFISVFLNPYTGKVLHITEVEPGDFNFFDFLMDGHLHLWLPKAIGKPIVSYGVLLFFITLLTGMFISWPKRWNKKTLRQHFLFHRPLRMPRLNWDLHNVLGYYLLLPLLAACWTGMMFGLDWFSGAVYRLVSGGQEMQAYEMPQSVLEHSNEKTASLDALSKRLQKQEPLAVQFYYALPQNDSDVYRVSIVHEPGSYYKQDNRYFDQYTLKELAGSGPWAGKYKEKSAADKMMRMNLDIHEGIVFGLFGKIIMLLACFVGASLPITGLVIYLRRKR